MRTASLPSLILLLCLAATRAADEPKPPTPAEKFNALVKEARDGQEAFSKAYQAAKTDEERKKVSDELGRGSNAATYADRFLSLVRENPKDPAALDAFRWLLARLRNQEQTDEAAGVVLQNWLEDERLEGVVGSLYYYPCPAGDRILRAAIDKSPHRSVKGFACFNLAGSLTHQANRLSNQPKEAREPFEREAQRLLERVVAEYADLKHFTTLGQEAEAKLFELKNLSVGCAVPEVEGEDMGGNKLKLSDYRGKVVLVTFWGTWCGPCMADVPREAKLVKRFGGKGFAVVGVNSDKDREAALKVCAEQGITWPSFWDAGRTDGPIAKRWNVHSWPTPYLIDRDGVIRYKGESLRWVSSRKGKSGEWEPYHALDVAVEELMAEAEAKKP